MAFNFVFNFLLNSSYLENCFLICKRMDGFLLNVAEILFIDADCNFLLLPCCRNPYSVQGGNMPSSKAWIMICLKHLGTPASRLPVPFRALLFFFFFSFFNFFFICGGFCHTLKWNIHGFTCVPHPDPPSHLPLHPFPLGFPSAPGPSACLMHPTWAGDLFHPR